MDTTLLFPRWNLTKVKVKTIRQIVDSGVESVTMAIELADGRIVCHHLDHICSYTVPLPSSVYKKCTIKWWQCNSACLWISLLSLVIYWTSQLYVPWDPSVDITAGLLFAPHHLLVHGTSAAVTVST